MFILEFQSVIMACNSSTIWHKCSHMMKWWIMQCHGAIHLQSLLLHWTRQSEHCSEVAQKDDSLCCCLKQAWPVRNRDGFCTTWKWSRWRRQLRLWWRLWATFRPRSPAPPTWSTSGLCLRYKTHWSQPTATESLISLVVSDFRLYPDFISACKVESRNTSGNVDMNMQIRKKKSPPMLPSPLSW